MEALVIVLVVAVAALITVVTWFGVRNDGGNPIAGRGQLEAYRSTLLEKARRAQAEQWDEAMVARVAEELDDVELRLARMGKRAA
jgi:hypothetical protein